MVTLVAGAAAILTVGGCDQLREVAGVTKRAPDEFTVVTHAPLSLPPDFNLRPPKPGAPRPQEDSARSQAQTALIGSAGVGDLKGTQGEVALLQSAGAQGADPAIRQVIDTETTDLIASDSDFVQRLIFWQNADAAGTTIDPTAESKRLQNNQALGKPATEGDTPTIKRRKRGILEGIF
jgi:hypothetical protein